MSTPVTKPASTALVFLAFAIIYIVWGSTYFFIGAAVAHIPPMLVGAIRFIIAGGIMLLYCVIQKEKIFQWSNIRPSAISGLLMLVGGNGILIWTEQYLASSLTAILLASGPIWFVILDKRNWKQNLSSGATIAGLLVGMIGVVMLFAEKWLHSGSSDHNTAAANSSLAVSTPGLQLFAMFLLLLGALSWAGGSLYSKYNTTKSSNSANAGWQMLAAGIAFSLLSVLSGETSHFKMEQVPLSSWLSVLYLVTMGSLAGYSAFVWLLKVRSATQVSTHAYVNPVVAVILGSLFGGEQMSALQLFGLAVILVSVLLINLHKYTGSLRIPGLTPKGDRIKLPKGDGMKLSK